MVIEPAVEPSHTAMSFEAVMDTLRDLGAQMFVAEGDVLHYVGPRLDDGDPIRIASTSTTSCWSRRSPSRRTAVAAPRAATAYEPKAAPPASIICRVTRRRRPDARPGATTATAQTGASGWTASRTRATASTTATGSRSAPRAASGTCDAEAFFYCGGRKFTPGRHDPAAHRPGRAVAASSDRSPLSSLRPSTLASPSHGVFPLV